MEAASSGALGTGPVTFAGAGAELHLRIDGPVAASFTNVLSVGAANSITLDVQPSAGTVGGASAKWSSSRGGSEKAWF